MGTYSVSLRAIGDTTALPATVELEDGQLSIAAGSQEIGSWALADIELEPLPNGYRMAAEGDQIIIELKELDAFREALENGRFKRRFKLRGKERKSDKATTATAVKDERVAEPHQRTKPTKPSKSKRADDGRSERTKARKSGDEGLVARAFELLDTGIARAHKRYGPYLPDWMFSRAMFFILVATLIVMLVFPGISSTLLLICGGVIVAFGAVTYSDPMLASRWLPGRTQPPHALIIGVVVLLLGVLLGVLAG